MTKFEGRDVEVLIKMEDGAVIAIDALTINRRTTYVEVDETRLRRGIENYERDHVPQPQRYRVITPRRPSGKENVDTPWRAPYHLGGFR